MKTPKTSKHFKRLTDPKTGVPYYLLTTRVAKYQQGFYFVNNSMTRDGRYLWFMAAINPIYDGRSRIFGYIDFLTDEVVLCHDAAGGAQYIDPDDGTIYFVNGLSIYKREPGKDKLAKLLCTVKVPGLAHIATHMTRSSDKKSFFLDLQKHVGGGVQGLINIETGEFTEWCRTERPMNHGQLNPKNDGLGLLAYDHYVRSDTGEVDYIPTDENGVYQRLWTLTDKGERRMHPAMHNYATHEWWSDDGKKIYYCCDYYGIYGIDLETGKDITILEGVDPWHAHCTKDESLFVYDEKKLERYGGKWYRGCPAALNFLNRKTGKHLVIISEMPENGHTPSNPNNYHIDPHPRFTENEKYIVFSTSELGGCDLALCAVDELIELTK